MKHVVIFPKRKDAVKVYKDMLDCIKEFGFVSVYDFYDMCGFYNGTHSVTPKQIFLDDEYSFNFILNATLNGWTSLPKKPTIVKTVYGWSCGYSIVFPDVSNLVIN